MSYSIIFGAFGAFAVMFVLQMIVARIVTPNSEDKFIIAHYVVLPFVVFIAASLTILMGGIETVTLKQLVLSYLLYFVLASSWVASYPAIYASCPTLIISYIIARRENGITAAEFHNWLRLKGNSEERIDDALSGGLIEEVNGKIRLKPMGKLLFLFFDTYKRILGLSRETL